MAKLCALLIVSNILFSTYYFKFFTDILHNLNLSFFLIHLNEKKFYSKQKMYLTFFKMTRNFNFIFFLI